MKIRELTKQLIVPPGSKISLKKDYSSNCDEGGLTKIEAKEQLALGVEQLAEYQSKLYAQDTHALLIILQAMDAAGKDGTIKHVMTGLNPQGCQVHSFKAPSSEELDHDYLWRCAKAVPGRGEIGIFNRSYYEEVLITRVHPELLSRQKLPPNKIDKKIWKRRFQEINNFEEYLVNNGIMVLKFFLNISKEEQKKRFLQRINLPEKNWKFSMTDVAEREHWDDYLDAYEDCFNNTSTAHAPWYIVPADYKPFMRLAVSQIICETLKGLDLQYPSISKEQKKSLLQAKASLEAK